MNRFSGIFFHWLPIGVITIGLCGLLYVLIQQSYRSSLNDPQIQMAEDAASALAQGKQPAEIVPRGVLIDADKSLAPFIAVYDKNGNPLEASAMVNNLPPKPPIGVFEHAKINGENRVTWQPSPSTRIALVVRLVPNGSGWFVAAGRNMREVERRELYLAKEIGVSLIIILAASFVFDAVGDAWRRRAAARQIKS